MGSPWRGHVRVTRSGEDDAQTGPRQRRQAPTLDAQRLGRLAQPTLGGGEQERPQRGCQSGQDDLRLRITEAGVALEQDGPVGGQHQPGVQGAAEARLSTSELGEDRSVEPLDDVIDRLIRQVGSGL